MSQTIHFHTYRMALNGTASRTEHSSGLLPLVSELLHTGMS